VKISKKSLTRQGKHPKLSSSYAGRNFLFFNKNKENLIDSINPSKGGEDYGGEDHQGDRGSAGDQRRT
jgi:hypothetical protein